MSLLSENGGFFPPDSSPSRDEVDWRSLQTEGARLLHGGDQLLIEHGEGGVRGQVQAIEASVSPGETL